MSVRQYSPHMLGIKIRSDDTYRFDQGIVNEVIKDDCYNIDGLNYRVKKAQCVVDIGANIGVFSALVHNLNPECKIWAVEPNPNNLGILKENIGSYAKVIDKAITSDGKPVRMAMTDGGIPNTVSCRTEGNRPTMDASDFTNDQVVEVESVRFDEMLKLYDIPRIDILKIDCEGCEEQLLASSDIKNSVKFIVGEFHQHREFEMLFNWAAPTFEMRILSQRGSVGLFWARNKLFSSLPCGHLGFDPSCRFCKLERTDSRYYHLWTNDMRDFFDARSEALSPITSTPLLTAKKSVGVLRELPCIHLGSLVQKARCSCPRKDIRKCDLLNKNVTQEQNCEVCMSYEMDDMAGP